MSSQSIPLYQKVSEEVVRHSLNNTTRAIDILEQELNKKGYHFVLNQKIGHYNFNFYCPKLRVAIEIDGYAHEFLDIHNQDAPKKLFISSLGITVLRFTDYQIFVDMDEVFRILKNHIQSSRVNPYVV
ncbi:endonuclease domain-containing protein [Aquimarina sp. 2304DJ70-9]|uniref:endonuclease domain-containing protein n=1 Tax=Aquimarina penaris TaxID=3231044 RepID=UPI0034629437